MLLNNTNTSVSPFLEALYTPLPSALGQWRAAATHVTIGLSRFTERPARFVSPRPGQNCPFSPGQSTLGLWSLWNQLHLGKPWPGINLAGDYSEASLTHNFGANTEYQAPALPSFAFSLCWLTLGWDFIVSSHDCAWVGFKDDKRPSLGLLLALLFTVSFFLIKKRKEGKKGGSRWRGRKKKEKKGMSP